MRALQAGSLQFLADNKFDFNKWVRSGIPYLPLAERDQRLAEEAAGLHWDRCAAQHRSWAARLLPAAAQLRIPWRQQHEMRCAAS